MFLKLIKRCFQAFFTGLLLLILFLNFKLYYSPDFSTSNGHNEDVLAQLNYLEQELHAGAAEDMQQLFPEGHVFTTVLYGLAWADFADPLPNGELKARALREID